MSDQQTSLAPNRLKSCPDSPNCVSTEDSRPHFHMDRLPLKVTQAQAIEQIKTTVLQQPRVQLVQEDAGYLHFTFRSRLFGFVDDVEFLVDSGTSELQYRSASRLGYGDLGVNRSRMEALLAELKETLGL